MIIISDAKITSGIFNDTTNVLENTEGTKFCYSHNFTQADQDIATGLGARVYDDEDNWKLTENWTQIETT